jgi:hypothetical protein
MECAQGFLRTSSGLEEEDLQIRFPLILAAGMCLTLAPAFSALGQEVEANDNTVVYDEAFFAQYNVNNAEDCPSSKILEQVSGLSNGGSGSSLVTI